MRGLEAWRARQPVKEPKEPLPPPLLTLVTPGTDRKPPVYTSNILPRPKSALKGPRRVPRFAWTMFGVPFLRLKKPQPKRLSGRLMWLFREQDKRLKATIYLRDYGLWHAKCEDEWERRIRGVARAELKGRKLTKEEEEFLKGAEDVTYTECLRDVDNALRDWITRSRMDGVGRARALLDIVKKEKALAEQEAREAGNDATG